MRRHLSILLAALSTVSLLGESPLQVGVSVLPLETLVREIGGDEVVVRSLQQAGDSCSVFEPRPSSIAFLAEADLFFRTGVGYETVIMDKIRSGFDRLVVVDLRQAVDVLAAPAHDHSHDHEHGHSHDHDHSPDAPAHAHRHEESACTACGSASLAASDPHIWLDPQRLVVIAHTVARFLAELRPESAEAFAARALAFTQRAHALDARIQDRLRPFQGRAFFIYHPALGYFAQRYGLEQVAITGSGPAPTARELQERIRQARAAGISAIFIQPQESRDQAEIVAKAIGARLIEIDPMAMDWEANLEHLAKALEASFTGE